MSRPDVFYQPPKGENSGLPHDPFKSFVIPHPIGWISTTSQSGQDNLAPYSQFNNVSFDPPTIMFPPIHSFNNAKDTGEFVWNMATSQPPRVAESPVQFECQVHSIIRINEDSLVGHSDIVIGRVVGIHIKGDFITGDGLFDVLKAAPLARLGYHQYTAVNNIFETQMSGMPDDHVSGNIMGGAVPKYIDDKDVVKNGSEEKKTI
ncbi:hypothetical protein EAF00_003382 [Botryotinia globosa]|nr:hypothetical protein EAF00_003382 [Botryotinia globosa]